MLGPHAMIFFADKMLLEVFMVLPEEFCRVSLFDREMTDLSNGRLQSRLQSFLVRNFEVRDVNVSGEKGGRLHHKGSIGLAVQKLVMCMNGVPNDDDGQNAGMRGHKTGVDGLASVCSRSISNVIELGDYAERTFSGPFHAASSCSFVRVCLYLKFVSVVLWGTHGGEGDFERRHS